MPQTKAATAAGVMKRQAEMPAARMAISSLRRFRETKAASTPNRNTNGSSTSSTAGAFIRVSRTTWAGPMSTRLPTSRDTDTKSTRSSPAVISSRTTNTEARTRFST